MGSDMSIDNHGSSPLGESFVVLWPWKWILSFLCEWSLLRSLTKLTGHFSSRPELASLSAVAGEHAGSEIEAGNFCVKSLQSWLTLCDPMDCNPPGSSVCRILQERILEWVAMCPPPGGSSWPRDQTRISWVSYIAGRFLTTEPPGKPAKTFAVLYPDSVSLEWSK